MAEIRLLKSHWNEAFAEEVASYQNSVEVIDVDADTLALVGPRIVIKRATFDAYAAGAEGASDVWRVLAMNRTGRLETHTDEQIVVVDDDRPVAYNLRFDDPEQKTEAEHWAEGLGLSLKQYILDAIQAYNRHWRDIARRGR